MAEGRSATLYRMVLPDHVCPYGVRAKELLTDHGFEIDEHLLRSREEVDSFKQERGLRTTPLIMIGDEQIGGCDDLERHLADAGA